MPTAIRLSSVTMLSLMLSFCAALPVMEQPGVENTPTVQVTNNGVGPLRIHIDGDRVGYIEPNQTRCIRLPNRVRVNVTASAVGSTEPITTQLSIRDSRDWTWVIAGQLPTDGLTVMPVRTPCKTPSPLRL